MGLIRGCTQEGVERRMGLISGVYPGGVDRRMGLISGVYRVVELIRGVSI